MEKYTLNLDENNFVLSIAHTPFDDAELDLTDVELHYLNAYQYLNGTLILNAERKAEIIAEEEEREKTPSWEEAIEAQVTYTALMTDTLIDAEEDGE